ncbi:MAG: hypothetical protein R2827_03900 [Bdellovibrionales bacterium]
MEGYINGYFKQAVWQGKLLTQFNAKLTLDGKNSRRVYFSSRAMKNFMYLLGLKDTIEQMEIASPYFLEVIRPDRSYRIDACRGVPLLQFGQHIVGDFGFRVGLKK